MLLTGVGLGLTMQNLVLAVQNDVAMADLGAASSTVTFFRSLGGTAGVAVLGSVLAAQVSSKIAAGLPPGTPQGTGGGTLDLAHLPGPIQALVRGAYGDAMATLFLIAAIAAVVTVVAVVLIKEVPLRTSMDVTRSVADTTAVDGPVHLPVDADLRNVDNSAPGVDNSLLHVGDRR